MATNKSTTAKARKAKQTIDLATAQVADGALAAPRSIREVIGQAKSKYTTTDIRAYRRQLEAMPFHRIQEHCYELGVVPAMNKEQCINRLEEAFAAEFRTNGLKMAEVAAPNYENMTIRQRAEAIMSNRKRY